MQDNLFMSASKGKILIRQFSGKYIVNLYFNIILT